MRPLIIPFFIPHSGCPHTCLFCNQHLISGEQQLIPDSGQIQARIAEWLQRSPGRFTEVAFFGGSFTLLDFQTQQRLLTAVHPFICAGKVQGIRISTRPDALGEDTLRFLKEQQVTTVEVGVQSLDDMVLQCSGRGHTVQDSLDALKRVRQFGITVGAQLLPGLPGDTEYTAVASMQGVLSAGAQLVRIYPAVVMKGTAMADLYLSGAYRPPDLETGVRVAAKMMDLAYKAGIPVARVGLQSEEGLAAEGTILAGCWHPALGQLVRSRIWFDLIIRKVREDHSGGVVLECHPNQVSELVGNGGSNRALWRQAGLDVQSIRPSSEILYQHVVIESENGRVKYSVATDLIYEELSHA